MPLINGQKMACEPCIRGHRSTKCTHANERLMVPVRKPGRPLSSCPHPASRPCSCAQVTAAIPRKQKCHCGTKATETSKVKSEKSDNSESSKDTTPQSPSKATNPSYRVQKTTNKNGASNSSRRQSVDPAAFERMDPSMLNVIPSSYNGVQQSSPVIPDMSAFGAMGMVPADGPFGPMVYPMLPPHMAPPMMSPDLTNGMSNGHSASITNGQTQQKSQSPIEKTGSCCGGGGGGDGASNGITAAPPTTQSSTRSSTANSSPTISKEPEPKSCCSSGATSSKPSSKQDILPSPDTPTPAPNGIPMMAPFQTPMVMPNGMYGYYPHPTIFTYPPQYGSYLQPLQPEQWRQVMASMAFAPPGAMPAPYAMPGHMPFQHQGAHHQHSGTSHQCSCGASCQCVGCAAHPYNEATQNYVRSAWQSMMDDSPNQAGHTNGNTNNTQSNGSGINEATAQTDSPQANTAPALASIEGTRSPTAPQTPSDAPSGMSEEQALSASDFFFVSYPFGDSCAGDTASCPCGDDCQCFGCVIHNNPDPATETGDQAQS